MMKKYRNQPNNANSLRNPARILFLPQYLRTLLEMLPISVPFRQPLTIDNIT